MLEVLLLVCLVGLLVGSTPRLGFGNPFQVYFGVWFALIFAYWISRSTYIAVADEAIALLLIAKVVTLVLLFIVLPQRRDALSLGGASVVEFKSSWVIWIGLAIVGLSSPFVYQRALELSGSDIFTVIGYMRLRAALTDNVDGYGLLAYLTMPSYVLSSVCVARFALYRQGLLAMLMALAISLFYTYLSTGRTFILLLLVMLVAPLVLLRKVRARGIVVSFLLTTALFIFVAGMTSKGVSIEDDLAENIDSVLEGLRAYTIAPLVAFSRLVFEDEGLEWGANTFRLVYAVLFRFGLSDLAPVNLVREYVFVPDPTNVYTVYDVYFSDFSYFGMLIPPLFMIGHWVLFRRALERGGVWIFYAGASLYPLLMQFFQDQYVSILSQWVQLVVWYWVFTKHTKSIVVAK